MAMDTPLIEPEPTSESFPKKFCDESKRLWHIAGPAMFTMICQYSTSAITQLFCGHLSAIELAAFAVQGTVIGALSFGVMLGMGSALETLCGQAFGSGRKDMLGIYMQRSFLILLVTACCIVPLYVFAGSVLKFFGETTEIANATGKLAVWMIPQLFGYAVNFPMQKFLQAQRKVIVVAVMSGVTLPVHAVLSWLVIFKLDCGLIGAAVTLNVTSWLYNIAQFLYIVVTKSDGAWTGFSSQAFSDLWNFVKLSIASAVMLCLEMWYLTVLVVITGLLPDALVSVDALTICMSINGWDFMIALGFNAAISVRISNELGAGNAARAKFAVLVVSITSVAIGTVAMVVVYATRHYFPHLFTNDSAVAAETTKLALLVGISVLLNSLQPVLSGVAIGAGWQGKVAYINIVCYYLFGLPAGILLGFTLGLKVMGIWGGMIWGLALQTIVLIVITSRTNWKKEVEEAGGRVKKWGGAIAEVHDET